jgi:hypothetical protein
VKGQALAHISARSQFPHAGKYFDNVRDEVDVAAISVWRNVALVELDRVDAERGGPTPVRPVAHLRAPLARPPRGESGRGAGPSSLRALEMERESALNKRRAKQFV